MKIALDDKTPECEPAPRTDSLHPLHRRVPSHKVFVKRMYPWRSAVSPISRYIRQWLASGPSACKETLTLRLSLQRLTDNLEHCYPRGNDVIWATAQRAGYYWLGYMYAMILMERFYCQRISLVEAETYRHRFYRHPVIRYDFREDLLEPFSYHLPIPRLMHTHAFFQSWMRGRRVLIQIRNPHDLLISKYYFNQCHLKCSLEDFLETEAAQYVPAFFNSWGEAVDKLDGVLIVRFEDLRASPNSEVRRILEFLEVSEVTNETVHRAVEDTKIEKIRELHQKKIESDGRETVSHGRSGKVGQSAELSARELGHLNQFVAATFRYSFGYEIEYEV